MADPHQFHSAITYFPANQQYKAFFGESVAAETDDGAMSIVPICKSRDTAFIDLCKRT